MHARERAAFGNLRYVVLTASPRFMLADAVQLRWMFPVAILSSTVAVGSAVSGAPFFSLFFLPAVGLSPAQAIGGGLLTEMFGMGNGPRGVRHAGARGLR